MYSINKNHIFSDGNKRSSIYFTAYFLELNGHENISQIFIRQMEEIAVWVADNKISKDLLQIIISQILQNTHSSERFISEMQHFREGKYFRIEDDNKYFIIDNSTFQEIILSLLYEEDYSEELKTQIRHILIAHE